MEQLSPGWNVQAMEAKTEQRTCSKNLMKICGGFWLYKCSYHCQARCHSWFKHTDAIAVVGHVVVIALLLPFVFIWHAFAAVGYYIAIVRRGSLDPVVDQGISVAIAGQAGVKYGDQRLGTKAWGVVYGY